MKFSETWLIPTVLALWVLVTVVISFFVLKTMQKAPGEVSTDWPANIIAMIVGLTTAVLMAGTIYVSAKMSSAQIAAMQTQIQQLEDFRALEKADKDKKALFEIEHYFKSYEDMFYETGSQIRFLDEFLDTKNQPLLNQSKAKTWVDDTPRLTSEQKQVLSDLVDIVFRDRYKLPDKPSGLDRLPSSFSRSYQSLVRMDRRNEKSLKSMSRELDTEYDAIRFYRALRKFQYQLSGSFGGLVYEMEKYSRSLNNLAPVVSQEEWRNGIFRIDHPNRLALETVRYPRMKIWAKEQLEYRKYSLAEESVEFEIEVLEGNDGEFEVENMKLRMRKAMGYILHYYDPGVTEFKQRLPAPQDRERLEFDWK